jgi:uncharacterized membrane protein YcaP (DUF421 family)
VQPLRQWGLLLALALPALAALALPDEQARLSVLHVGLSFCVLLLAFRLLGKRELSRLSPFELVTLMLIPEILSNFVQGQRALLQGIAGLCTVLGLVLFVSLLSQRFATVQRVLEAGPTVLVLDGKMLERAMNWERIAPAELLSEMRKQGLSKLEQVHLAVLESSGNITFIERENE